MKKVAIAVAFVVVVASVMGCQQQAAPEKKAAPAKAQKVEKAPATKAAEKAPAKAAEKTPAPAKAEKAATMPAAVKAEAGKDGWTLSYTADFSGAKLDKAWLTFQGDAAVKDGKLIVSAESQDATVLLTSPVFAAASVRLEMTASLADAPKVSDLSIMLNATKTAPTDSYLFQFGGKGNTVNGLNKRDELINKTITNKPLVVPGKKYKIIAENDKGHLKLIIDGETIVDYVDPKPLSGKENGLIGFYTWESKLVIEKLAVYEKK